MGIFCWKLQRQNHDFCLNYCPRYREILVQKARNSLFFFGVINLWKSGRKGNQCFVYFCNVEATRESDLKKIAVGSSVYCSIRKGLMDRIIEILWMKAPIFIKVWQVIFFSNQTIHNLVGAIQKVLKGRFRAHQNGQ